VTWLALFVPSELKEIGLERSLDMPKKRPTPEQIVTLLRQIEVRVCLDHVVIWSEAHLRRVLTMYAT
jgi:hypothetical protein